MKLLDVYSFDFDGSLSNYSYLNSSKKDIVAANKALIEYIKSSRNKKKAFIGSNRQSFKDDFNNADEPKGSCFLAFATFCKAIGAKADFFLLADLYNGIQPGDAYKKAVKYIDKKTHLYQREKLEPLPSFANCIHDTSKLTMLYAQIHKTALEYPKANIQFSFFDDREDLLQSLHDFFSANPQMIPQKVTLNLKRYLGALDHSGEVCNPLIVNYEPITGTALNPDKDYINTVKKIASDTIEAMAHSNHEVTCSDAHKPIINYEMAEIYKFRLSPIDCIKQYQPQILKQKSSPVPSSSYHSIINSLASSSPGLSREQDSPTPSAIPQDTIDATSNKVWDSAEEYSDCVESSQTEFSGLEV